MDNKPLTEFVKEKLGISVEELSRLEGVAASTLKSRWNSKSGHRPLKCMIFDRYVRRFWE